MDAKRNTNLSECEKDYLHCSFSVIEDGVTLASVCCFLNPHHLLDGQQVLTFGSVKCPDDLAVFTLMMNAVVAEAQSLGFASLIGPISGSTWNNYRIVTTPQENPFFLEVQSPLYYEVLFKDYGFQTLARYKSTLADSIEVHWERSEGRYKHFLELGVVFQPFDLDESEALFSELASLCNEAFKENFLFSPISTEDFVAKMRPLKALINPDYTIVAKHDGKMIGFIFCYQDINNLSEKTIVVKTLARDPSPTYKGIGSVLSSLAMRNVKAAGFTKGIHALMVDFNSSTYLSDKFKAEFYRRYELLSYKIEH
jgi:hypothetical protein